MTAKRSAQADQCEPMKPRRCQLGRRRPGDWTRAPSWGNCGSRGRSPSSNPGSRGRLPSKGIWPVLFALCLFIPSPSQAAPRIRNILKNPRLREVRGDGLPASWVLYDPKDRAEIRLLNEGEYATQPVLEVSVLQASERPWGVQVRQRLDEGLPRGTVLGVSFDYRVSPEYAFTCYLQQEGGDWQKYIELRISDSSNQWQHCSFNCRIPEDIERGHSSLCFHLAAETGQVRFRGFTVEIVADDVEVEGLQTSEALVLGGDAVDRTWRRVAKQRLLETRRGTLTVSVRDEKGTPVPGTHVRCRQTTPLVPLGARCPVHVLVPDFTGAPARTRLDDDIDLGTCASFVTESDLFSHVLLSRAFTWQAWEQGNAQQLLSICEQLAAKGLAVHANGAYTPAFRFAPPRCRRMVPPQLNNALEQHLTALFTKAGAQVERWTVVESPLTYPEIYDLIGTESLVRAFQIARKQAPEAVLLLGEDKALTSPTDERLDEFVGLVRWLQKREAPIDGLAMRVSAGHPYLAPKAMEQRLNQLTAYVDLPLTIAGLDIDAPSPAVQARRMSDMLLLFASRPEVEAIYLSEIWAPLAHKPRNALFDAKLAPKPAANLLKKRFLKDWRTETETTTDTNGEAVIEGFTGRYAITVGEEPRAAVSTVELDTAGTRVNLVLPQK